MPLLGFPSDVVTDGGTVTWAAGTEDPDFPLMNAYDRISHTVAKTTGTSGTLRVTFGAAQALHAVAFIHTSATAITATNSSGLNVAVPIPAVPPDLHRLDPWLDLRTLPNPAHASATQWNFAMTATNFVAIGEVLLISTLRPIHILWASNPEETEAHHGIILTTHAGVRMKMTHSVRQRSLSGVTRGVLARSLITQLQRDARGAVGNFPLIWDDDRNDALFVDLVTDSRSLVKVGPRDTPQEDDLEDVRVQFLEQQKGLRLV